MPSEAPKVLAAAGRPASPGAPASRREIASKDLFAGGREVYIRHEQAVYTLRRTSRGKLILTK